MNQNYGQYPQQPMYFGNQPNMNLAAVQQQRLAYMEQQNPQFMQPMYQQPVMQTAPVQTAILKGRAVSGLEEVKASTIDFDGSVHVFTDFGNNCVYTKQIGDSGKAIIRVYELKESEPEKPMQEKDYASKAEMAAVLSAVDKEIQAVRAELKEVTSYVSKYNVNDVESGSPANNGNGKQNAGKLKPGARDAGDGQQ